MNNKEIDQLMKFLAEARKLQSTLRFTPKNSGGFENDAEHSWAVALTCMLLSNRLENESRQKLDQLKILKMALIHDMGEIKTGDTKTWDAKSRIGKEDRERAAVVSMCELLPNDMGREFIDLWDECEEMVTLEAKIVRSIDRLDPVIHRALTGVGWENLKDEGEHSTIEALDSRQLPRHSFSKTITSIYNSLREIAKGQDMFPD
jgi:putative hydrolase of HD superfamily